MAVLKRCPHCGGTELIAEVNRGAVCTIDTDGSVNIINEFTESTQVTIKGCMRCKTFITETDLVAGAKCTKCGRVVSPEELDENGVCTVCNAPEELLNASKEDLILMLLNAKKNEKKERSNVSKKVAKAEQAALSVQVNNSLVDDALNGIEQTPTVESTEPKKRKRAKRKTNDSVAQAPEPVIVQDEQTPTPLPEPVVYEPEQTTADTSETEPEKVDTEISNVNADEDAGTENTSVELFDNDNPELPTMPVDNSQEFQMFDATAIPDIQAYDKTDEPF